jgi:hypothetical protein
MKQFAQFALVEAPSTSLDELTLYCLPFAMQQLHGRVERLVSRHFVQQVLKLPSS